MAARFTASGQSYTSTAGLPGTTYTVTCWIYMVTDRNAVSGVFGVDAAIYNELVTTSDGTTLQVTTGSNPVGAFALTPGIWYRIAVTINNQAVVFYHAAVDAALTNDQGNLISPLSSPTTWRIGTSHSSTLWFNGRIAAFKAWSTVLTQAQIERELSFYLPQRTTNLLRFHPFLSAETTDYSGLGRTLSGSGSTTEPGPPISWKPAPAELTIPWDPSTTVWYAVYDNTTGDLISTGSDVPGPGLYYKAYLGGQPDLSVYEWDTTVRDFVLREGVQLIDRVTDLVADASLASVWATLDSTQDTALQDRIGQLLGPYRYRYSFQNVDLT
jgi:hypothetical protein